MRKINSEKIIHSYLVRAGNYEPRYIAAEQEVNIKNLRNYLATCLAHMQIRDINNPRDANGWTVHLSDWELQYLVDVLGGINYGEN